MPKMFLRYPQGAITKEDLRLLVEELTEIGLQCERIPRTAYGQSTAWIYAHEYDSEQVFVGGRPTKTKVFSIEVNAFQGGLDDAAKETLIQKFTAAVGKHTGMPAAQRCPVFVLIRESPASDWGIYGNRVTLEDLRNPPPDAVPV